MPRYALRVFKRNPMVFIRVLEGHPTRADARLRRF